MRNVIRALCDIVEQCVEVDEDPQFVKPVSLILAVCKELRIEAMAIEVGAVWANAAKIREAWPEHVGGPRDQTPHTLMGGLHPDDIGRWAGGYLVAIVDNRYLVDVMAGWQRDRLRGIATPSSLVAIAPRLAEETGATAGCLYTDGQSVTAIAYTRRTINPSILNNPSWVVGPAGGMAEVALDVHLMATEDSTIEGIRVLSMAPDDADPHSLAKAQVFAALVRDAASLGVDSTEGA